MKKQHIKKTLSSWVLPKRELLKKLLVTMGLLLGLNYGAVAQNTAYGTDALISIITGDANVAFGYKTLYSNTTGSSNMANGYAALLSNTTGSANTANGYFALFANTTGNQNTANGSIALYYNTTGSQNTANGSYALYRNTTGTENAANGHQALYSNTTGNYNTALGAYADVTSGNLTNATAIGANAKVSASNTIQLGNNAVTKVFAGVATNATLIAGTLQTTSGAINTANSPVLTIEVSNQKAGRIDANNAFYGYQSGKNPIAGGFNTAMGFQSLNDLTTGDGNTAIGDRSLLANRSGKYNTAVGSVTLNSDTAGEYNTAIGYAADVKKGVKNSTAIGNNTIVNTNNKIRLGDASITEVETQFKYTTVSDGRFKTNINEEEVKGLEFIKKLRPVVYNFDTKKFQAFLTQNMPADVRKEYMNKDFSASTAIRQSGFIAQEVEKAAQEVGYDFNGVHKPESANDNYSLAYSQFVVPLVKGMQEQQKQIEEQQKVNQQLQQRLEALEKLLATNTNITKDVTTKEIGTANAEDINLYPNPTTGIFTITANNINNGIIEIYDMAGNSMQKTTFNNAKSGYQLNVSGYAKGVYLLNIIANNKKYTKRLVIQ